jgi:hypothetical protein
VMCSQVTWFTFAFPWGPNTTEISGMYLDRQFGKQGQNGWDSFFWLQNKLSTEVFRFGGIKDTMRTVNFWWRKKGEILFKYTGAFRGQVEISD